MKSQPKSISLLRAGRWNSERRQRENLLGLSGPGWLSGEIVVNHLWRRPPHPHTSTQ